METPIESLPGSENIQIPPSIERQLEQQPQMQQHQMQQIQVPQHIQTQVPQAIQSVPNVSFSITKKSPDFAKIFTSREFILLVILFVVADSRYLNVLFSRHLPIVFIKNNTLLKMLLKVGLLAVVFVLVRAYFLK